MQNREPRENVSHIVLGTMTFGESVNAELAHEIVSTALSLGVNRIDTANAYSQGKAEAILGEMSSHIGQMKVATKVGIPHADAGAHAPLSQHAILQCVEGSLRRLDRERVDLLYLHQPDRSTPLLETMETFKSLLDEKVIGGYGLSNYPVEDAATVFELATTLGMPAPQVSQQMYNLVARKLEEDYIEFAKNQHHELMVYNPLAGGLLTGRYRRSAGHQSARNTVDESTGSGESPHDDAGGRYTTSALAEMYRQRYWKPSLLKAVDELYALASAHGLTLIELAMRWVRAQVPEASILMGVSSVDQLQSNIRHLVANDLPPELVEASSLLTHNLLDEMPDFRR